MKNRERLIRILMPVLAIGVTVGIIILIQNFRPIEDDSEVMVGGIFAGDTQEEGWNKSHYTGVKSACDFLSCSLLIEENVAENEQDLREAVTSLIDSGCGVIFLTSNGYGDFADLLAADYPETAFFSTSGRCREKNCMSYFARIYQARYIAGIAAGACSKTGILGFVAVGSNPQTNRGINAYALGARLANPDARILVRYTGSWDNEEAEKESVRLLADKGADVFTYHEEKDHVIDAAEEMGLCSTGYEGAYSKRSERFLTAAMYDWKNIYRKVLGDYLNGSANFSSSYWLGFDEMGVDIYPFSNLVDGRTRILAMQEKKRIQTWRDVFSGEIYDNKGVLRCDKDEKISDDELFNGMDWFVEGVEIYEE